MLKTYEIPVTWERVVNDRPGLIEVIVRGVIAKYFGIAYHAPVSIQTDDLPNPPILGYWCENSAKPFANPRN